MLLTKYLMLSLVCLTFVWSWCTTLCLSFSQVQVTFVGEGDLLQVFRVKRWLMAVASNKRISSQVWLQCTGLISIVMCNQYISEGDWKRYRKLGVLRKWVIFHFSVSFRLHRGVCLSACNTFPFPSKQINNLNQIKSDEQDLSTSIALHLIHS